MRKKDRTSEERTFDASLKSAIKWLGPNPPAHDQPIPFPYVLKWDRLGRRGQACKIIRQTKQTAQVKFTDGFVMVVNRLAIRRG